MVGVFGDALPGKIDRGMNPVVRSCVRGCTLGGRETRVRVAGKSEVRGRNKTDPGSWVVKHVFVLVVRVREKERDSSVEVRGS